MTSQLLFTLENRWLFLKTNRIPCWLALWGFFGVILYFAALIFDLYDPQRPALLLGIKWGNLMAPLAIQEMVFALWMIIKGFNPQPFKTETK